MSQDLDPLETREWLDALDSVVTFDGADRATFLLDELLGGARRSGVPVPYSANTPYLNTIPPDREPPHPGDQEIEQKIRSLIRWNAIATVLRANKESSELGGHIASYQSAATLYEVGFNHFWNAPSESHGGDLVYIQGHSSPGIYARAFAEGRLDRRAAAATTGRRSMARSVLHPHPWLMPDFWQFPTVSMGLGPLDGHLPGAVPQVLACPRLGGHARTGMSGRSSATARWTSRSPWAQSPWAEERSSTI